jgi:Ca2+-binding RTX toxin-like protein
MKKQIDIPGNVSTKAKIEVGGSLSSTIATTNGEDPDQDWIAVKLTAGTTYTFSLTGSGATPLEDPLLELLDGTGTVLIADDDSGDGRNSLLVFTADKTGTYYINASSFPGQPPGDYTVTVELGDTRLDTPPDAIDGTASVTWNVFGENNTTVEVYFAQANDGFASLGWSDFEIEQALSAFSQFSNIIDVNYVQVFDSADADLVLITEDILDAVDAYFVPSDAGPSLAVFDNTVTHWASSLAQGGTAYTTLLHEFGHFLGLGHTHDPAQDDGILHGVTSAFGDFGDFDLNQTVYTAMSYNNGWFTGPQEGFAPDAYGKAGGLMAFDIAILQEEYGANLTWQTGDDTYLLPTLNGVGTFYSCIWDAAGDDTISAENATVGSVINLNDATLLYEPGGGGFISFVGDVHGGFTIANGVIIENAIGGSGADLIIGNEADNILAGGNGMDDLEGASGEDALFGEADDDVLIGGSGEDQLYGGSGADSFVFIDEINRDTVHDYIDGTDVLDMREQTGAKNFHQLKFIQEADGVVIDYQTGSVLLLGVSKAELDAEDFLF